MRLNNSADISDVIDNFYDYDVCTLTRTIEMSGEVNLDFYKKYIKGIHFLDNHDEGTIHIKLNCEGGDISHALAIYDAIQNCKNYVRIIGYGEVYSAASIIIQAGDERLLTKHTKFMIHQGEEGYSANHQKNIETEYNLTRIYEKEMEDIYLSKIKNVKPRFTRKKLKDMLTFDRYMTPKEVIELGLADKIGDTQ